MRSFKRNIYQLYTKYLSPARYFLPLFFGVFLVSTSCFAETGYRLWLRYDRLENSALLTQYRAQLRTVNFNATGAIQTVARQEFEVACKGLLGETVPTLNTKLADLIVGTAQSSAAIRSLIPAKDLSVLGDGYLIRSVNNNGKQQTIVAAQSDKGVLYGIFHLIRLLQTQKSISRLSIREIPLIKARVLNHWDNLDGTVERGYAGTSLWDWHKLPGFTQTRYTDYARANASVGINGTVLNNVKQMHCPSLNRIYSKQQH